MFVFKLIVKRVSDNNSLTKFFDRYINMNTKMWYQIYLVSVIEKDKRENNIKKQPYLRLFFYVKAQNLLLRI